MAMLVCVSIAFAGSIESDCTKTDMVCTDYENYCTHWHFGHCDHWGTRCVNYEKVCTDSTTTDTEIDADTVNGRDVTTELDGYSSALNEQSEYISSHESSWTNDQKGASTSSIMRFLTGDHEFNYKYDRYDSYLEYNYCTKEEYDYLGAYIIRLEDAIAKLSKRVYELETK